MKCQSHLICCKIKKLKNLFFYNSKPKLETDFGIKKYKRKYMTCVNCKHMFAYFDFNLDNLYDENYSLKAYGNIKKIKITFNKIIQLPSNKSDNKKRVLRCLKYLKKKDQIFDIGCGLSVFLYELKKKNYKVYGLEPDKYLFKHSKNIIGRNIYNSSIEKFSLTKKKKFDFVSLNKVLEHTMSPEKMILKIRKLLKLNGIFYLEVPDQLSATKGKEREELMVEHLHVFSKMSLKNLMVRNKFKILQLKQIKEPSGKYTIFGFFRKIEKC